jgi:hypothetical protein
MTIYGPDFSVFSFRNAVVPVVLKVLFAKSTTGTTGTTRLWKTGCVF